MSKYDQTLAKCYQFYDNPQILLILGPNNHTLSGIFQKLQTLTSTDSFTLGYLVIRSKNDSEIVEMGSRVKQGDNCPKMIQNCS